MEAVVVGRQKETRTANNATTFSLPTTMLIIVLVVFRLKSGSVQLPQFKVPFHHQPPGPAEMIVPSRRLAALALNRTVLPQVVRTNPLFFGFPDLSLSSSCSLDLGPQKITENK